ncbi:metal ABC transporter ATP-binding protein [Thermocrispum agreste]|jgi:manganese/zinc/iron transport system ATP- binding protein|uniref:Metal ABC transporter ATP-binding protein n=1 Tax=Thermocrispum agreste TaxID=37925 RepID=A0A2W4J9Z1_9PSEU|nr:metal ABC transporter ATP-binding protein [Thermocrispum agreste]PZM95814.1 MAG: metal ABC transporter ATP-binding protein [Thermocrispum agreste]
MTIASTSHEDVLAQGQAEYACVTRNLSVAYRDELILRNVDLRVPRGVVMGVVGPNGAGKSTLIKAMLGLVKPLTGTTEFFGRPLAKVRQRVGYMPQSATVDWDFPTTVQDVVLMGTYGSLGWLRRPGKAERARAMAAMAQTGIADLASRQIGELSGGQRQRVFLARALVQSPDLFFMDEPFQGVDAKSQQAIVGVLHTLREQGKTVVIVHHDLMTVRDYCDHVTLLNRRVVASGPAADAFTKEAIRTTYDVTDDDGFLDSLAFVS